MSFEKLGLSNEALRAVKSLGYENPTPVQAEAIPAILEGHDVIAAASTGTGKTAAFLLPVVSSLEVPKKKPRAPRVLIVTPTRELAEQIAGPGFKVARACGQFVMTAFGGTPYTTQIRNLRRGADVLVATPGRLCDLMKRGVCDLSSIETLVLDEADRMLDMGFIPDIKKIVAEIPEERQTLLFSATIDASIRNNFDSLLTDPKIIQIASRGQTSDLVEQYIVPIAQKDKAELLKCLLDEKEHSRVVVFARTRDRVCQVCEMLKDAGYSAVSIHSDKTQGQRREALSKFRKGKAKIIVATDVLARGIDVPEVDYVVNYDLPDMAEDYIHRIGRTGRAGEEGFAVSFVSNNSMKSLTAIEKLIGKSIPVMRLDSFEIDMGLLSKVKKSKQQGSAKRKKGVDGSRAGKAGDRGQGRGKRIGSDGPSSKGQSAGRGRGKGQASNEKNRSRYDYTGWGDLRKGKKHRSERMEDESREGSGRRNGSRANGRGKSAGNNGPKGSKRSSKRPGWRSSSLNESPKKGKRTGGGSKHGGPKGQSRGRRDARSGSQGRGRR